MEHEKRSFWLDKHIIENLFKTKPLIAVVGPTAVGKTEVSLQLCHDLPLKSEVMSADSMQVYRNMDIGTAKPDPGERKGIIHHMINVAVPWEDYSVGKFQKEAKSVLNSIYSRQHLPVLVGGTGLYVNALIYDYSMDKLPKLNEYRKKLNEQAEIRGMSALYEDLKQVDPKAADNIHPNDKKRIIRALEVYYSTGEPISKRQERQYESPYNLLMFGLYMDRAVLYQRIEKRVDKMIEKGLIEEVDALISQGVKMDDTAMQGLGYKEIVQYLKGDCSRDQAVDLLKKNTKKFAKRQLSWFRRDPNIKWFDITNKNTGEINNKIIDSILKEYFK